MKRTQIIIVVLICVFLLSSIFSGCNKKSTEEKETELGPNEIKVMSYNVKTLDVMQDVLKTKISYANRKPRMMKRIEEANPDIIGIQEATSTHNDDYIAELSEKYGAVIYYREGGETPAPIIFGNDEAGTILYKKEKFELLEKGCWWLSDTPEIVGSNTWGASHVRICSFVKLKVKATGKIFWFNNTHLNWGEAQEKASTLLKQRFTDRYNEDSIPYMIVGDFNLNPSSDNYKIWTSFMVDARTAEDNMAEAGTFNGFKDETAGINSVIDFVFVGPNHFEFKYHKVLNDDLTMIEDEEFASDHYAVLVRMEFN